MLVGQESNMKLLVTLLLILLLSPQTIAEEAQVVAEAKYPKKLQRLIRKHQRKLENVAMGLDIRAERLAEDFKAFDEEIEDWVIDYHHYLKTSPMIAAIGGQEAVPDTPEPITLVKNETSIKKSLQDYKDAERDYQLKVSTLALEFLDDWIDETDEDEPEIAGPVVSDNVQFANWLVENKSEVWDAYRARINDYSDMAFRAKVNKLPPLIDILWKNYAIALAADASATEAQRERGAALQSLDRLRLKIVQTDSGANGALLRKELSEAARLLAKASAAAEKKQYQDAVEIAERGLRLFDQLEDLGGKRKRLNETQAAYKRIVVSVTRRVLDAHGGAAWEEAESAAARALAALESDPAQGAALFEEALRILEPRVAEIRLAAARAANNGGNADAALALVESQLAEDPEHTESLAYLRTMLTNHPGLSLDRARSAVGSVDKDMDRGLCLALLAIELSRQGNPEAASEAARDSLTAINGLSIYDSERGYAFTAATDAYLDAGEVAFANQLIEVLVNQHEKKIQGDRSGKKYRTLSYVTDLAVTLGFASRARNKGGVQRIQQCYVKAITPPARGLAGNSSLGSIQTADAFFKRSAQQLYVGVSNAYAGNEDAAFEAVEECPLRGVWYSLAIASLFNDELYDRFEEIRVGFRAKTQEVRHSKQVGLHLYQRWRGFNKYRPFDHDAKKVGSWFSDIDPEMPQGSSKAKLGFRKLIENPDSWPPRPSYQPLRLDVLAGHAIARRESQKSDGGLYEAWATYGRSSPNGRRVHPAARVSGLTGIASLAPAAGQ